MEISSNDKKELIKEAKDFNNKSKSTNSKNSILEFNQKSVLLYNEGEREKEREKMREERLKYKKIIFFIILSFYSLLTGSGIIIQFKNDVGKNNLLFDDFISVFCLIIVIISLKYREIVIYCIIILCFSTIENIINDIIFFVFYIQKYKSSRHLFIFFISYSVIKFLTSFLFYYFYMVSFRITIKEKFRE